MREYEKMLAGELYNAADPELVAMRRVARGLLDDINRSADDIKEGDERLYLCKKLFGSTGRHLWLQPPFYCDYGKNIHLGDCVYFNYNCVVLDVAPVTIGAHAFFGPHVQIYAALHPLDAVERRKHLESGKPVTIGADVWVGGSAVICPGVTIGEGSVIAAGAVVVKDVPPHHLVGGNPAKTIRVID